jgi:hypothetical protein
MLRAAILLPVLLLAACGAPNSTAPRFETPSLAQPRPGDPRTNAVVAQACREQVAQQLQRQDRGQLMREDESQSRQGATFAGMPSTSQSDVMGRQFLFERRINECIRANTQQPGATVQPAPTPAATPAPASTRRGSASRAGS